MNRIDIIRDRIDVQTLIVTNLINIRYLTGYRGDYAILLITKQEAKLLTDFRYEESSKREVRDAEVVIVKDGLYKELISMLSSLKEKRIGFEKENIKYVHYEKLKSSLPNKTLTPISNIIEELRMKKDKKEIKLIKKACAIGDKVLQESIKRVTPYSKEKDIAAEIEYLIKIYGGEKQAFDVIVASGDNSALPHAIPTNRNIVGQNILLIDMGVYYNGYASDMTRTFLIKEGEEEKKIYRIVYEAQKRAIESIKPGVELKKIDTIARDYIKENQYGEYFGHAVGHGVGLNVHELPGVSSKTNYVAEEGMIFSVEPGIYVPDFGGVRIEDLILVTKNGYEIITKSPSSLTANIKTL
ncbi:aminopeptidase P family protein [candidate division WOR-3 bacterium]|nr:aminopeptidase P family protein [candidate division WOR-3 bacterium]